MKKLLLALLVTPATLFINAQTTENPFIKRGYDVLVATSSKGEYAEFHDQKDIVEIGSVLFNTKTNEVVALLGEGETTIDISSATTAMTIDPFCEKYYWISPYAYVANNPLKYIDPDGRKIVLTVGNKQYTYTGQGLVNQNGTKMVLNSNTHIGRVVGAYNAIMNSGDKVLTGKLQHLINSENTHIVKGELASKSKVNAGTKGTTVSQDEANIKAGIGIGSTTQFSMSKEEKAKLKNNEGVAITDSEIVAHEMQHQYDYDTGNMADGHFDANSASNPSEIRAVNNENRMRKVNSSEQRTTYNGQPIDPKKLNK